MSNKVKIKKSEDGKYPNTSSEVERVMMAARREISDGKLLAELLNDMTDWLNKLDAIGGK